MSTSRVKKNWLSVHGLANADRNIPREKNSDPWSVSPPTIPQSSCGFALAFIHYLLHLHGMKILQAIQRFMQLCFCDSDFQYAK